MAPLFRRRPRLDALSLVGALALCLALAQSPAQWSRRYPALARTLSLGAWERFERNAHLGRPTSSSTR